MVDWASQSMRNPSTKDNIHWEEIQLSFVLSGKKFRQCVGWKLMTSSLICVGQCWALPEKQQW